MSLIQGRPVDRYGSIIREESDDEMPQQDNLAVSVETSLKHRFLQESDEGGDEDDDGDDDDDDDEEDDDDDDDIEIVLSGDGDDSDDDSDTMVF